MKTDKSESIFSNNRRWIELKKANEPEYFKKLALGQSPEILYIGCSDSRVAFEETIGAKPGEVFVLRNIANMVNNLDFSATSVINYAVKHLLINDIVVCGHYQCGGVRAAMLQEDLGIMNPWLRNIRDIYRIHKNELNEIENENDRYDRFVELNVIEQCVNVMKIASVQKAINSRKLAIHAWVFDVRTGELKDLKLDAKSILTSLTEIYKLV
ncbi:MAG: carbonic anhydrase [Sphingobacteriaceae bacterium]|nr:carbonic anhydrase [Sphingobacteriaceae bacterium]MBP8032973.1 carbonic anhydrase [Bacteroidia bacterium]